MSLTTPQLASIVGFTAQDLTANQHGQLSARQQRRLSRKPVVQITLWVIVTVGFAALTIFLATQPAISDSTATVFVVGAFGLMASTMGLVSIRDRMRDATNRQVFNITGPAACNRAYEDPGYSYTATIGGRHFDVTQRTYEALKDAPHTTYRAYYLPHSGDLLSLEIVG